MPTWRTLGWLLAVVSTTTAASPAGQVGGRAGSRERAGQALSTVLAKAVLR